MTSDRLASLKTAFHISFKVKPGQGEIYTAGHLAILAFWGMGATYFWLMVPQVSAHRGREHVGEPISGHHGSKRPERFPNDVLPPKAPHSAFHHLLIMLSYYDPVGALISRLGHTPNDLRTPRPVLD